MDGKEDAKDGMGIAKRNEVGGDICEGAGDGIAGDGKGDVIGNGRDAREKKKRAKYLVVGLEINDSQPPSPRSSVTGGLLLCCLQTDLVLSGFVGDGDDNNDDDDEFIKLVLEGGIGIAATPGHGSYAPSKRMSSSPHRYAFMLWEQPKGAIDENIQESLGLCEDLASLVTRKKWDQEDFENRLGLGRVLAGVCVFY